MRISVFNFVRVAKFKPQKFGKKQVMDKTRQAKHIPVRAHINWPNPRDKVTADIRQDGSLILELHFCFASNKRRPFMQI